MILREELINDETLLFWNRKWFLMYCLKMSL